MKLLLNATIEALEQVEDLVRSCQGPLYNQAGPHSQSGVGKHVRHILDHFLALQNGLAQGLVDYNYRHRDSQIESDPSLALSLVESFVLWLSNDELELDQALTVRSEVSLSHQQSLDFDSNLARELCYLINHSVHHVAYAKLVAEQLGINLNPQLGIAPSTATYLRQQDSN